MKLSWLLLLLALVACTHDKPMPQVDANDPVWPLTQDRLEPGELK